MLLRILVYAVFASFWVDSDKVVSAYEFFGVRKEERKKGDFSSSSWPKRAFSQILSDEC